jgi:hypothetical protein
MQILDGLLSRLGMAPYGIVSLIVFFAAFTSIVIWTCTRPKKEIERQARLWEDDED